VHLLELREKEVVVVDTDHTAAVSWQQDGTMVVVVCHTYFVVVDDDAASLEPPVGRAIFVSRLVLNQEEQHQDVLWDAFLLASFDLASFDLASFDLASFDLASFDLASFDLASFDPSLRQIYHCIFELLEIPNAAACQKYDHAE